MKKTILILFSLFIALAMVPFDASAVVDDKAQVVSLRANKPDSSSGCMENGTELNNCFTSMDSLTNWISNIRKPTVLNPLLVDVGPGKFSMLTLTCNSEFTGYITFRGAGRLNTIIGSDSNGAQISFCTSMVFQDLMIDPGPQALIGIHWGGTGVSAWQNVEFISDSVYGWEDGGLGDPCSLPAPSVGQHYWFGSRIVMPVSVGEARAYISRCSEDWFLASEISVVPALGSTIGGGNNSILNVQGNEVHVYGGTLRFIAGSGVTIDRVPIITGLVDADKHAHIHGAAIDAISTEPNPLYIFENVKVHGTANAFNLKTGTGGSITRISGSGHDVHSPYHWGESVDVPFANTNVVYNTTKGSDRAIVTPAGDHPHFVLSDSSCPSGWYDIGTKGCR